MDKRRNISWPMDILWNPLSCLNLKTRWQLRRVCVLWNEVIIGKTRYLDLGRIEPGITHQRRLTVANALLPLVGQKLIGINMGGREARRNNGEIISSIPDISEILCEHSTNIKFIRSDDHHISLSALEPLHNLKWLTAKYIYDWGPWRGDPVQVRVLERLEGLGLTNPSHWIFSERLPVNLTYLDLDEKSLNIREYNFYGVDGDGDYEDVSSRKRKLIRCLTGFYPNLRHLTLRNLSLDNINFNQLNCLETLRLYDCFRSYLTAEEIDYDSVILASLRSFEAIEGRSWTAMELSRGMPGLTRLALEVCCHSLNCLFDRLHNLWSLVDLTVLVVTEAKDPVIDITRFNAAALASLAELRFEVNAGTGSSNRFMVQLKADESVSPAVQSMSLKKLSIRMGSNFVSCEVADMSNLLDYAPRLVSFDLRIPCTSTVNPKVASMVTKLEIFYSLDQAVVRSIRSSQPTLPSYSLWIWFIVCTLQFI